MKKKLVLVLCLCLVVVFVLGCVSESQKEIEKQTGGSVAMSVDRETQSEVEDTQRQEQIAELEVLRDWVIQRCQPSPFPPNDTTGLSPEEQYKWCVENGKILTTTVFIPSTVDTSYDWSYLVVSDFYAGVEKERKQVTTLKSEYPELWGILIGEGLEAFGDAVEELKDNG